MDEMVACPGCNGTRETRGGTFCLLCDGQGKITAERRERLQQIGDDLRRRFVEKHGCTIEEMFGITLH